MPELGYEEVARLSAYDREAAAARAEANLKLKFNNSHGEGREEYVRKKANARLPEQGRSPYHR